MVEMEFTLKDHVQVKMEEKLDIYMQNAKKMKAVLRLPMLTKKYHDLVREQKMPEFESLELVYKHHYENLADLLEEEDSIF